MVKRGPWWRERTVWTMLVGLVAAAFWIVGFGAGWRGWILAPTERGLVAHAQSFGVEAAIWWVPASVLTLTTALLAIGVAVMRHLTEGVAVIEAPETPPADGDSGADEAEDTEDADGAGGVGAAEDADSLEDDGDGRLTPDESDGDEVSGSADVRDRPGIN